MAADNPPTERGPRKWPRRIVIMLVLAVAVVVTFALTSPPPLPALPNPNGWDDFVKASAAVNGDPTLYRLHTHDQLAAFMATNTEALRLLRLGLSRQCAVPAGYDMHQVNDLIAILRPMHLLEDEARLAEMERRTNDAVSISLEAMRFGNEISRGGSLIYRSIALDCELADYDTLVPLVPALDCAQSKPVIAALKKLDDEGVLWTDVMRAERAYERHQFRFKHLLGSIWDWWQQRAAVKGLEDEHYRMLAQVRLLELELALRCYRAEHGVAPARLADLVPSQLSGVPLDPFSGKILTYRPQGTNWLLYSFDVDRVDDGGKRAGWAVPGTPAPKGDLLYDTLW